MPPVPEFLSWIGRTIFNQHYFICSGNNMDYADSDDEMSISYEHDIFCSFTSVKKQNKKWTLILGIHHVDQSFLKSYLTSSRSKLRQTRNVMNEIKKCAQFMKRINAHIMETNKKGRKIKKSMKSKVPSDFDDEKDVNFDSQEGIIKKVINFLKRKRHLIILIKLKCINQT